MHFEWYKLPQQAESMGTGLDPKRSTMIVSWIKCYESSHLALSLKRV